MNKRGQVAFFIVFLFLSLTIVIIGGIAAPLGARFSSELFVAGGKILNETRTDVIPNIDDPDIRSSLDGVFVSAVNSGESNIEISTSMFQWSWLVLLILTGVVFYLLTRQSIPYRVV